MIGTVRAYREAISRFAVEDNLTVWYAHLDVAGLVEEIRRDRGSTSRGSGSSSGASTRHGATRVCMRSPS